MSPVNKIVCWLIMGATALAVLETEDTIMKSYHGIVILLELFFVSAFTVEYSCRLYAVGENPRFAGWRGRIRYVFSFWSIIDLLAILPYILTLGASNSLIVRLVKLCRILRVARLGRFSQAFRALVEAFSERKYELALASIAAGLLLILSSTLLYVAEAETQPETFGSIPRALWWSVATLTTVGYGDVTPITPLGKLMAGTTALAGIGLIALPTGILAAALSDAFQRQRDRALDVDPAG